MAPSLKQAKAIRRESSVAGMIPISAHMDEHVARTRSGDYVQCFRLSGASFESADDEQLNNWHERLNVLWRNIASPHLALWAHVVRRRHHGYPQHHFEPGFATELDEKYRRKMAGETLMVNELYLSLVYRPQPGAVGTATLDVLRKTGHITGRVELRDALEECAKKRQELLASLGRYDPDPLGVYRDAQGRMYSSLAEFYGLLVNGEWQAMPLPRAPLNEVIATTRPLFGSEAMEYRTMVQTRLGAFLGIKEYPTPSSPGMFNALLTAPFPFVLTQSFTFLPKSTAVDLMKRQLRRMRSADDLAVSQAEDLRDALDDITSNRFVLGDHHFTLHVLADAFDGVKEAENDARLKQLNDNVARARFLLAETGMVVAREDLALEAAFWAQLPGNFRYRTRKSPVTSRNFSAMVPFHNYPSGRADGNHWGPALALLATSARSPFHFSLHASDPRAPGGGSRKDVGHVTGIGPVGTGKTTVIGFLISMLTSFGTTQVVFDKDEGLHILVMALGGCYLPLKNGQSTGCNPLQLPATPDNVELLKQWLRRLVMRTPEDVLDLGLEEDLDQALRGTLALERKARRLSRLVEFLDTTDPQGAHARLKKWCASEGGDYAWVFDNPSDDVVPILDTSALVGFDVTDFLDNPTVRDPMSMYLFHLVNRMIDGRRMVVWADEFAKLLADRSFTQFAKNRLEAWRKMNAAFVSFTQSPSHVLQSDIARLILEQTPTKIFLPNPDADHDEYTEGFGLSEREFHLIKQELEPGARTFLIKQNHASVVATLDLAGFDAELDVISGRTANVQLMKQLIAQHGNRPQDWLPHFRQARSRKPAPSSHPKPTQEALHA